MSVRSDSGRMHGDVYPVLRVITEYYLRGFDLLRQLQDDYQQGLIVVALLHDQISATNSRPVPVRELSRKLGVPFETVRRHCVGLVEAGLCIEQRHGLCIPVAVRRSRRIERFLRGVYVSATRVMTDLTRIGVARFGGKAPSLPQSRPPSREQLAIIRSGTATLLAGLKAMRGYWAGDVVKGVVYTAIWTANVKHVTNRSTGGHRGILRDDQRLPVSVGAIAASLRLPYETVRRHARSLVDDGICKRLGNRGLIVPESAHRLQVSGAMAGYRLAMDFLADLRMAGVKL